MRILMVLALASLSGACATLQGFETGVTTIAPSTAGATSIYSAPADLRSIVVVQSAPVVVETIVNGVTTARTTYPSQTIVCPQPPGDIGLSRTADNSFKLGIDAPANATDGTLEAAFRAGAAAAELAGRTPTVLLAREMLTFTCVQSALPPNAQAQANFNRLADMLENFSEADRQRAAAAAVTATTDAARAGADPEAVQQIVETRRGIRETRTTAIVSGLSLPNGSLNTTKRDQVAGVQAVQTALSAGELGAFRQLRNIPQLRAFLVDIEPQALAVLENASKS